MINIGLDYDKTYTLNPEMWIRFIKNAPSDVKIYCVTMRTKDECKDIDCNLTKLIPIINTNRMAKIVHVKNIGLHIDIWIDYIMHDSF